MVGTENEKVRATDLPAKGGLEMEEINRLVEI